MSVVRWMGDPAATRELCTLDELREFTDAIANDVRPAPPITPAGGSTILDILSRYTSDVLFERTTPEKAAQPFIDELSSSLRK